MTNLPPIERAIAVQPGDTLIATLPAGTAPDEFERVRAALVDELGGMHVVVTVGIDFHAYRRQDGSPETDPPEKSRRGPWRRSPHDVWHVGPPPPGTTVEFIDDLPEDDPPEDGP